MTFRELCSEFELLALAAVDHKPSDVDQLTAEQLKAIDDRWMPMFFNLRYEAHRRAILTEKQTVQEKAKGVSA